MLPYIFYRIKEHFLHIGCEWDELAPDINNVIEFAHTHLNSEPSSTTPDNQNSPEFLLARKGADINTDYRNDNIKEEYKAISEMLSMHTTDADLVLYRGVCPDVFKKMKENARNHRNCDLFEKGYLSSSLSKENAYPSIYHLRIYTPAGTHAVYLGNVNGEETKYYEVAVQHSAKLKVISMEKFPDLPNSPKCNYLINCLLIETQ